MARALKTSRSIRAIVLSIGVSALALPMVAQSNATNPAPVESSQKASEAAKQTPEPKADAPATAPASSLPVAETKETQIEAQTKDLYRLSAELRAEVAKTYKDTLSLTVLKKAEEIEKLAKSLKALMDAEVADTKNK